MGSSTSSTRPPDAAAAPSFLRGIRAHPGRPQRKTSGGRLSTTSSGSRAAPRRGQTNFLRMLWKFGASTTPSAARDHERQVVYRLRRPAVPVAGRPRRPSSTCTTDVGRGELIASSASRFEGSTRRDLRMLAPRNSAPRHEQKHRCGRSQLGIRSTSGIMGAVFLVGLTGVLRRAPSSSVRREAARWPPGRGASARGSPSRGSVQRPSWPARPEGEPGIPAAGNPGVHGVQGLPGGFGLVSRTRTTSCRHCRRTRVRDAPDR